VNLALPAAGFLVGLLVVSTGGGGGMIYVGILTTCFGISPALAASTSLATILPTTIVGAISHWKAGNVRLRIGLVMLASGAAAAVAGSAVSGLLPTALYGKLTGAVMLLLGLRMLIPFLKSRRDRGRGDTSREPRAVGPRQYIEASAYGILGGAMSGIVGLSGGGPIIAGLAALGCDAMEMAGTSVLVIAGISAAGFAMHAGLGHVDWSLVGLLASGTVLGALIGPQLLKRIDKKKLNAVLGPVFLILILGMGIELVVK
jgi:Predicted permeases